MKRVIGICCFGLATGSTFLAACGGDDSIVTTPAVEEDDDELTTSAGTGGSSSGSGGESSSNGSGGDEAPPSGPTPGMAAIPAGSFDRGCNAEVDPNCPARELPLIPVFVSDFEIDLTEVTQTDYDGCVDAGACEEPPNCSSDEWDPTGMPQKPVVCVDYDDATDYCIWAGKRLPTEAEWEKAARGSEAPRVYPWGNDTPECTHANHNGCGGESDIVSAHPMGDSPYGVADMAGNVREWVSDWYDENYYAAGPTEDPTGPVEGTRRSIRGGGYTDGDIGIEVSARFSDTPEHARAYLGFRCAKSGIGGSNDNVE